MASLSSLPVSHVGEFWLPITLILGSVNLQVLVPGEGMLSQGTEWESHCKFHLLAGHFRLLKPGEQQPRKGN